MNMRLMPAVEVMNIIEQIFCSLVKVKARKKWKQIYLNIQPYISKAFPKPAVNQDLTY